jgi:hypothetical protein
MKYPWASRQPGVSAGPQSDGDEAAKALIELASKMTPDQIAEAQRRAQEWKPTK